MGLAREAVYVEKWVLRHPDKPGHCRIVGATPSEVCKTVITPDGETVLRVAVADLKPLRLTPGEVIDHTVSTLTRAGWIITRKEVTN